ncbi:MAG: lyase family protein [Nitrospiria bacterium]
MDPFESYQSVFSWRYGSHEMRRIFSEAFKRRCWRRIWVSLARAKQDVGLLSPEEFQKIEAQANNVDVMASLKLERVSQHDLDAELQYFASQCGKAGATLHVGAAAADIKDNADALILRDALNLVKTRLAHLIQSILNRVRETHESRLVGMGYTHLQPAVPIPFSYRLANYGQDLLKILRLWETTQVEGKGIKGAVGTSSGFSEILGPKGVSPAELERRIMEDLGLPYPLISGQTSSRLTDVVLLGALQQLAVTLHRMFTDQRILQSMGETQEPFMAGQKGSSVMAHKKNPKDSEQICSLAAAILGYYTMASYAASNNLLERTLNDSAIRRIYLPEAFLATDQMLIKGHKVISGLKVNEVRIVNNLRTYGDFASTEKLLLYLQREGLDREVAYRLIQKCTLESAEAVLAGWPSPMKDHLIIELRQVGLEITREELDFILDPTEFVGDAFERVEQFLREAEPQLAAYAQVQLKEEPIF